MSVLGQSLNLLSSILTILLTCPNSDTLLCYSNDPFLTVYFLPPFNPDYESLAPMSVSLDPLSNKTCFAGVIINDLIALEEVEDFFLVLNDPLITGLLIGRNYTTVDIIDDDGTTYSISLQ